MKNAINRALAVMKTKVLFSALCLLVSISVCAGDEQTGSANGSTDPNSAELSSDLPKLKAEEMPEYPGGVAAMMNFIRENVKYPEDAKKDGREGRVICSFTINKQGKVTEPRVVRSSGTQSLDDEAVRVIRLMPDWIPGKEKGEPVNVQYTMPVVFKL